MDTAQPAETITTKPTWITEGLLIASAPVAAYLLALNYISWLRKLFSNSDGVPLLKCDNNVCGRRKDIVNRSLHLSIRSPCFSVFAGS